MSTPLDYRSAGVDIEAADDAKWRIKRLVESTFTAGTRGAFGGFGGMFRVPPGFIPTGTMPLVVRAGGSESQPGVTISVR